VVDNDVTPPEPRKQRMGATPQPASDSPTEEPAAAADVPQRTRMGAPAEATDAPRPTRMGSSTPAATPTETDEATAPIPSVSPAKSTTKPTRVTRLRQILLVLGVLVLAIAVVVFARWLRTVPEVAAFVSANPGAVELPAYAPVGLPAWLGWQHFFNIFFMVLIVRTGWQVRTEKRAPGYWTANEKSFYSPALSSPKKVSLTQWIHQSLDVVWLVNGVVFVLLLAVTGQWMRIVPLGWDYLPNALSTALQYASLDWPTENGWINYNALQVLAYFTTVFVAAPLAAITGYRFSTWWPDRNEKLSKSFPIEWARAVHFPVMLYFVGFTAVHVFLVFFTGALANLNHIFTARDAIDAWGLAVFAVAMLIIVSGWFVTKPFFMGQLAARFGTLSK
jgi:thiosulfate reductase cytochrome b subunit